MKYALRLKFAALNSNSEFSYLLYMYIYIDLPLKVNLVLSNGTTSIISTLSFLDGHTSGPCRDVFNILTISKLRLPFGTLSTQFVPLFATVWLIKP
jgi:hypothetical protein